MEPSCLVDKTADSLVTRPGKPHRDRFLPDRAIDLGDRNAARRQALDLVEQPEGQTRREAKHGGSLPSDLRQLRAESVATRRGTTLVTECYLEASVVARTAAS